MQIESDNLSEKYSLKLTLSSSESEDEFQREHSIKDADSERSSISDVSRSNSVFDFNHRSKRKIPLLRLHAPDCDDTCCGNENGAESSTALSSAWNTVSCETWDTPFQALIIPEYEKNNSSSDESEENYKRFKRITKKQRKLSSSDEEILAQEKISVGRETRSCGLKVKQSRRKQSLKLLKVRRAQSIKTLVPYTRQSVRTPPKDSGAIREKLCKLKLIRAVGKN